MRPPYIVKTLAAAALLGITLLPVGAHAGSMTPTLGPNIVPNGGFEQGADPGVHLAIAPGSPLLGRWTVVGGEVSVYGTYWQAEEGTRSLALGNPSTGPTTAGSVKQSISTTIGQRYRMTFYQSGNPNDHQPSTLRVTIGSRTQDFTYQAAATASTTKMDWVARTLIFTAEAASTAIGFSAYYTPGNDPLGLDNVQVRAIHDASDSTGVPAATLSLKLGTATVAAGGSETVTITAAPKAAIALVINAPDGSQVVLPAHADSTGRYSYTWNVPASMHGTAHVFVDSAGTIAQAVFTVS